MDTDYLAMRKESQEKRAYNRERSTALLTKYGVEFTIHNGGAHIIVKYGNKLIDFYPGTGKWSIRSTNHTSRRGVFRLIKQLGLNIQPEDRL